MYLYICTYIYIYIYKYNIYIYIYMNKKPVRVDDDILGGTQVPLVTSLTYQGNKQFHWLKQFFSEKRCPTMFPFLTTMTVTSSPLPLSPLYLCHQFYVILRKLLLLISRLNFVADTPRGSQIPTHISSSERLRKQIQTQTTKGE